MNILKIGSLFLKGVILFIGILTVFILVIFPTKEGRAANLSLLEIYFDPLVLYVYASSSFYFHVLFKVYQLLSDIGRNHVISLKSLEKLKSIKKSSFIISLLILFAGIFILFTHDKNDDPVGFLVLCFIASIISFAFGVIALIFEKLLEDALDNHTKKIN